MQHGPLQHFHLYLNHGIALCKYSTREEANKAQMALNNCVLGNTTICAESPCESEVQNILQHLGVPNQQQPPQPQQQPQVHWPNSPPFDTPKSNLEQLSGVTHNSTKLRNKNHCSHFSSHKILNNNHNNHNSHHQDNKHLLLHYLHNGVHLVKTHRIVPRVSVALLETSTTKTSYPHNSRTAMKSLSVNHQGFRLSVGFIRSRRLPTNLWLIESKTISLPIWVPPCNLTIKQHIFQIQYQSEYNIKNQSICNIISPTTIQAQILGEQVQSYGLVLIQLETFGPG